MRFFHSYCIRIFASMVTGVISPRGSNTDDELCKISHLVIGICVVVIFEASESISEGVCHSKPRILMVSSFSVTLS